jgi:hypothetical protein
VCLFGIGRAGIVCIARTVISNLMSLLQKKLRILLLLMLVTPSVGAAPEASVSDYSEKSEMIVKIARFVNWPDSAFVAEDSHLVVCLLKGSPFTDSMADFQGAEVHGHPLEIVSYRKFSDVQSICQVLIVSHLENRKIDSMIVGLGFRPILTIDDSVQFAELGGIIGLQSEAADLSFTVNIESSQRVGLVISAQLLELATAVISKQVRI